jgi:hypothetical protein
MQDKIGKQAEGELLEVLRHRYRRVPKSDKGKILDEFVAVAGCHRKHAVRLLTADGPLAPDTPVPARRTYDEAVREALIVLWEAADRICGKRLEAALPGLVAALEGHGHLDLDAVVRQRVLEVSAATIDRLLASARSHTSRRKKRRAKSRSSKESPPAPSRTTATPRPAISKSTSPPTAAPPCKTVTRASRQGASAGRPRVG